MIKINILLFLGQENELNRSQPSLAHIYIIRGLIGDRLQTFTKEAAEFVQPYLSCLNSNEPYAGTSPRATTSYEQVVERRGAEMIIRIASNIQYMKICLEIIRIMTPIDFFTINESFVDQAEAIIMANFGPSTHAQNGHNASSTNLQTKLMITKDTCEEAVNILFKIFMPQHFTIMNYRFHNDVNETPTELDLQTKILKVKYHFFHKTTLSGNNGVLKNIDKDLIDHLLNRLVRRGVIKKGFYLQSEKSIKYESYMKYLPYTLVEQQQLAIELNKHHMSFEEYRKLYQASDISPPGTRITPDGNLELQKQDKVSTHVRDDQQQQQLLVSANIDPSVQHNQSLNSKIV
jgi:hypothetical protein